MEDEKREMTIVWPETVKAERMRLKSGDVLVVTMPKDMSKAERGAWLAGIRTEVEKIGVTVVALPDGALIDKVIERPSEGGGLG
jgi:hypothetical protein